MKDKKIIVLIEKHDRKHGRKVAVDDRKHTGKVTVNV